MNTSVITGIVCDAKPIFENDKRVHLFSRDLGRITAIAKYAVRSSKRFGGRLEPTTVIEAHVNRKPTMWAMTDASVSESFLNIRTSFNQITLSMYFLNLARKITVDYQPHPALFDLLIKYLRILDGCPPNLTDIRHDFETELLIVEGIIDGPIAPQQFMDKFSRYTGGMIAPPIFI